MFKMLKNQKGMTLVELLAVMVIVGIIAAISIPAIGGLIENSRKDAAVSTANSMVEAARMYVAAAGLTDGRYTLTATGNQQDTLQGGSSQDTDSELNIDLVDEGYLEDAPINPQTKQPYNTATVVVQITNSKATYTITLQDDAPNNKYNINGKTSDQLNRNNVGVS